jgi:hypothetical protein
LPFFHVTVVDLAVNRSPDESETARNLIV